MSKFTSETELAQIVMDWMTADGWDCFPEAQFHAYSKRADIAAARFGFLHVVECKRSMSLALLAQAQAWIGRAHYVSIAVPAGCRTSNGSFLAEKWCKSLGIGVFMVNRGGTLYGKEREPVYVREWPRLNRAAHRDAKTRIGQLHEDMKQYAPGAKAGYSSPYRRTMDRVREFIQAMPGCTVKDILDNCSHHYLCDATARSCIPKNLMTIEKGIRAERDGRMWRFYPEEIEVSA